MPIQKINALFNEIKSNLGFSQKKLKARKTNAKISKKIKAKKTKAVKAKTRIKRKSVRKRK